VSLGCALRRPVNSPVSEQRRQFESEVPEAMPERLGLGALLAWGGFGRRRYGSCGRWVKRQISPQGLR
jgi:hypothetical protein